MWRRKRNDEAYKAYEAYKKNQKLKEGRHELIKMKGTGFNERN